MQTGLPDLVNVLEPDAAADILALGRRLTVATGTTLFTLGATADCLYVVEHGRIALRMPMHMGGQEQYVMVEERGPGQSVGWSALIPPHRFTLEAAAVVDSAVLALPRERLLEHFAARPAIGYAVTRNVAALVGQRLQVIQAMWLREVQRLVELRYA
jgi:CRP-like cAMP-binding protein